MTKIAQPQISQFQQVNKRPHVPKPYQDVAEGFETQFANHLITEMRKTINKSKPSSSAEKIYESMQDYERAKIIAQSEPGLGVKEVILDQIYPAHRRQAPNNNAILNYGSDSSKRGNTNE